VKKRCLLGKNRQKSQQTRTSQQGKHHKGKPEHQSKAQRQSKPASRAQKQSQCRKQASLKGCKTFSWRERNAKKPRRPGNTKAKANRSKKARLQGTKSSKVDAIRRSMQKNETRPRERIQILPRKTGNKPKIPGEDA